jgi:alkaline phosphatase
MSYVDGFLLPIPKAKLPEYKKLAKKAAKVFLRLGALEYRECVGDDLFPQFGLPFPKLMKLKPDETVVFAWIVYKSKAHRDKVNKAMMTDPQMEADTQNKEMPFDVKRMGYGGFKTIVEAMAK